MAPPRELHGAAVHAGSPSLTIESPVIDVHRGASGLVADRRRALLRVEGVGTFGVDDGRRVDVAPDGAAEPGMIDSYLNGTVTALLFAQRGRFALHANSVEVRGRAVAVAGVSGAGKSTTAIRLLQRGHRHLTDDFALLEPSGEEIILQPTDRGLRLWPATADLLGVDISDAVRPITSSEKVVIAHPPAAATRLHAIVAIDNRGESGVEVEHLRGAGALSAVVANVYRGEIVRRVWGEEVFAWASTVAAAVPVVRVTRPALDWTVDGVADAVEAILR